MKKFILFSILFSILMFTGCSKKTLDVKEEIFTKTVSSHIQYKNNFNKVCFEVTGAGAENKVFLNIKSNHDILINDEDIYVYFDVSECTPIDGKCDLNLKYELPENDNQNYEITLDIPTIQIANFGKECKAN